MTPHDTQHWRLWHQCGLCQDYPPKLYRFPKNIMSPLMVKRLVKFFSTVTCMCARARSVRTRCATAI